MISGHSSITPNVKVALDAAGTMIVACDPHGTVRLFNTAAERLLGWNAREVVGRHTPVLWHDRDEIIARATELTEEVGRHEDRYRCQDGSWRLLAWTSVPQPDGLMYTTARDITDLKRAEEALRKSQQDLAITLRSIGDGVLAALLQAVADGTPDAVFVQDRRGRYLLFN